MEGTPIFFYSIAGASGSNTVERAGPIRKEAFSSLIAAGYVTASTLVWSPGFTEWIQFSECAELSPLLTLGKNGHAPLQDISSTSEESGKSSSRKRSRHERDQKQSAFPLLSSMSTWIFVSELPIDVTLNEIAEHFKKAGIIRIDIETGDPKVILHKTRKEHSSSIEANGERINVEPLSRSASICYLKPESVELAMQLLDGAPFRPDNGGFPLSVKLSRAVNEFGEPIDEIASVLEKEEEEDKRLSIIGSTFRKRKNREAKGEALAVKARNLDSKERAIMFRTLEQKLKLGWADEGTDDSTGLCIVILRNMFTIDEMKSTGAFLEELREDILYELEDSCGKVTTLMVFDRHPEGVVFVKFASPGAAALCINKMNGRFFGGRRIICGYWDGVEEFKVNEDESEAEKREEEFGKWIESQGGSQ
jgi:HIV Tat-specific factor 1